MQQLPGESREMAVTVEDGGACDRRGHPGTKVLTLIWTSEGEEDGGILSVKPDRKVPCEC